jgi:hypothetical protein
MSTTLKHFITRLVNVEAVQLTSENLGEAAQLSGAEMVWNQQIKAFALVLPTPRGNILAKAGMWLVSSSKGWVAMTDKNFRDKYERANQKGERVPPYSIAKELVYE